jgi:hypothetical protein
LFVFFFFFLPPGFLSFHPFYLSLILYSPFFCLVGCRQKSTSGDSFMRRWVPRFTNALRASTTCCLLYSGNNLADLTADRKAEAVGLMSVYIGSSHINPADPLRSSIGCSFAASR